MTYEDFEKQIMQMAASATEPARLRFAVETIELPRRSAEMALATELTEAESRMLARILAGVASGSLGGLRPVLQELTDSLCKDEVRAIESDPDVTELLCAIENLLEYAAVKDPRFIGRLAINMVNSIDYAIGGDCEGHSIDNVMAAAQMRAEYERQKRLLAAP